MLGTVSAALPERIRAEHGQVPLLNLAFSGEDSPELDARLEAFAYQVRRLAAAKDAAREPRHRFESLWRRIPRPPERT